jgi:nicotinate-nucleotide pyrophosphorylase (carboxylating)
MSINLKIIEQDVSGALNEDIGPKDITAQLIAQDRMIKATIMTRQAMCFCGTDWVRACFLQCDSAIDLQFLVKEGDFVAANSQLVQIQGNAKAILTAERTALNFLQTLSATATQTKRFVDKIAKSKAQLLDTRKTLPGLRYGQKYAVRVGGGTNHRFGLYDAFLIKENHIKSCGSIANAIARAKKIRKNELIEVEVEHLAEFEQALYATPDVIMLDNFTIEELKQAVKLNTNESIRLEASGGVNLQTIEAIAATGVDYISVGEITKSIKAIDLSLLIEECDD